MASKKGNNKMVSPDVDKFPPTLKEKDAVLFKFAMNRGVTGIGEHGDVVAIHRQTAINYSRDGLGSIIDEAPVFAEPIPEDEDVEFTSEAPETNEEE